MGSNGNGVEAGLNKCPIVSSLFSASIDQLVLDNKKVKSQGFSEIVCWNIWWDFFETLAWPIDKLPIWNKKKPECRLKHLFLCTKWKNVVLQPQPMQARNNILLLQSLDMQILVIDTLFYRF